jgi:hypothetical protein
MTTIKSSIHHQRNEQQNENIKQHKERSTFASKRYETASTMQAMAQ